VVDPHPLAKAQGGAITIESELGQGSTFHLRLPVASASINDHHLLENNRPRVKDLGVDRMTNILLVEDDEAMATALRDGFAQEGYAVTLASDGATGLAVAQQGSPDLVILDVMLPKMSGHDVCRSLRQAGMTLPIIMLSARGQEIDKVVGLKLGADDYVTKPFGFMELLARVEAVLRRTMPKPAADASYRFGDVVVDFAGGQVIKNGEVVDLSAREFRLLQFLVEHRGQVVARDTLLDEVWDYDRPPLTRTVDMHVAKLRKKIEADPADPRHILTVHGMGYKFADSDESHDHTLRPR
jgi:DNA-binding response OmpR family regulator